jgi:hypothetical protein
MADDSRFGTAHSAPHLEILRAKRSLAHSRSIRVSARSLAAHEAAGIEP